MVIDIHCHPPLKTYLYEDSLFSVDLERDHSSGPEINLSLTVDIPKMTRGGVRAAVSAHYVPEGQLVKDSWVLSGRV